jgi:hypothetical protein
MRCKWENMVSNIYNLRSRVFFSIGVEKAEAFSNPTSNLYDK